MYSPIKTINVTKLIKDSFELNIICYDRSSDEISKKLIYIVMNAIELNNIGKSTDLFVSPSIIPDLSEMEGCYKPTYIEGLKIQYINGLDVSDDWDAEKPLDSCGRHIKYFRSLGGSLPYSKNSLIMIGTKDKVLLGAY